MTIPVVHASFVLATATLPLLLALALVVDLARWLIRGKRFAGVRLVAFGWVYLLGQVIGLAALGAAWLVARTAGASRAERLIDSTYAIQSAWARALFFAVRSLFGLRLDVEGDPLLSSGPFLLFMRHTSIVDTLLPTVLVTARHGIRLRFVLKRDLLSDPCLDVAGGRLPNYFVDRTSSDSAAEVARVGALAKDLSSKEGVLIYPEGTRFTPEKRQRAIARLTEGNEEAATLARSLTHVLPPRLGGPLALLEAAPDADVVFMAHVGLDGFASIKDIFGRALSERTIRVAVWRVAAARIPKDREARARWLYGEWQRTNDWVAAHSRSRHPSRTTVSLAPS